MSEDCNVNAPLLENLKSHEFIMFIEYSFSLSLSLYIYMCVCVCNTWKLRIL
jgi:hypothetical protein